MCACRWDAQDGDASLVELYVCWHVRKWEGFDKCVYLFNLYYRVIIICLIELKPFINSIITVPYLSKLTFFWQYICSHMTVM